VHFPQQSTDQCGIEAAPGELRGEAAGPDVWFQPCHRGQALGHQGARGQFVVGHVGILEGSVHDLGFHPLAAQLIGEGSAATLAALAGDVVARVAHVIDQADVFESVDHLKHGALVVSSPFERPDELVSGPWTPSEQGQGLLMDFVLAGVLHDGLVVGCGVGIAQGLRCAAPRCGCVDPRHQPEMSSVHGS